MEQSPLDTSMRFISSCLRTRDSLSPAVFKSALLNILLPSPLNLVFPLTGMSLSNNHHL